jgi:hypothetical protein
VGLTTGLKNIQLPGDIPYDEWNSWHTLIVSDELSRVVCFDAVLLGVTNEKGLLGSLMGSRWGKQHWCSAYCELRDRSSER